MLWVTRYTSTYMSPNCIRQYKQSIKKKKEEKCKAAKPYFGVCMLFTRMPMYIFIYIYCLINVYLVSHYMLGRKSFCISLGGWKLKNFQTPP